MGPGRDWSFINALASKIRARHRPARDKSNLRLSDELLDLGLRLITAAAEQEGLRAAVLHRDGLMSALLALAPLRRRNFAALRLGENRVETNGSWIILLEGAETKTHAEHEIMWPQELFGPLLESPEFRQAYARLLVDEVTVSDEAIRISGRKTCCALRSRRGRYSDARGSLFCSGMARPKGFEPLTPRFVVCGSDEPWVVMSDQETP